MWGLRSIVVDLVDRWKELVMLCLPVLDGGNASLRRRLTVWEYVKSSELLLQRLINKLSNILSYGSFFKERFSHLLYSLTVVWISSDIWGCYLVFWEADSELNLYFRHFLTDLTSTYLISSNWASSWLAWKIGFFVNSSPRMHLMDKTRLIIKQRLIQMG